MPLALMFLSCWLWWPLGIAFLALFFSGHWMLWPLGFLALAFIIGSGRMGCWNHRGMNRWENKMQRMQDKMDHVRARMDGMRAGGRPSRLQVSILIGKSNNGVGVTHVYPLGIVPGRIEGDAIRTVELRGENAGLLWLPVGRDSAKDLDLSTAAFCQEEIAIGSRADQPWIVESRRIELHGEPRRSLGPGIVGARN